MSFTFLGILQPLDELFHLLEENALPLAEVGVGVPLQYGLFAQNIRCEEERTVLAVQEDKSDTQHTVKVLKYVFLGGKKSN